MKRFLIAFVLGCVLLGLLAGGAFAAKTVPGWYPAPHVPILIPPFGPGVWGEMEDPSVPPSMDVLVQASDPQAELYQVFPAGRDAFMTVGYLGSVYGQMLRVPRTIATVVDITGPDGFHQHWDAEDTAPCWTGAHPWDEWWDAWLGGPPPGLFNPEAQAGVYFNHLWLPVGPFPTAGTYHVYFGQYQLQPSIEMIEWYAYGRPYHYGPEDLNWEIEYDFNVGP